jgi:hypothetical protein
MFENVRYTYVGYAANLIPRLRGDILIYGPLQKLLISLDIVTWQIGGVLRVLRFPPPIKLTATILLTYC